VALIGGVFLLSANRIASGVTVAGVSLGGDSSADAKAALQQAFGAQTIVAADGDRQWPLSLADLGIRFDLDRTLAAVKSAKSGAKLSPFYNVDLNLTQSALTALSQQANVPAVSGLTPVVGRAIDIAQVMARLQTDLNGELADGILPLVMTDIQPAPYVAPKPIDTYTGPKTTHVVETGEQLALIAKLYNVSIQDIVNLNDIGNADLLYIGQTLTIPAAGVYEPTAAQAPAAPTASGHSIVVSLGDQRIYAYDNGTLVHSHVVSTGLERTPTVLGDFKIYVKYLADDMAGPGYDLKAVPYTMYFYQGYAIHGAYWHNDFGMPMSHGCVNLPVEEAKWFYEFASVGTPVRVIA
jgi:lipoprotein-anchoring transpeptidase ErfK/SrfK